MARKKKQLVKKVRISLFNAILINSVNFFGNLFLTVYFKEQLDISARAALALTLFVLFCVNFILFRYVVYRSRQMGLQQQFVKYFVATIAIHILEYVAFSRIQDMMDYRLAVIIVTLGSTTLRFILYKFTVFKK